MMELSQQHEPIYSKCRSKKACTFTTCLAASSAGSPLQAFTTFSKHSAFHTPSEAIISLPPAFESYNIKSLF